MPAASIAAIAASAAAASMLVVAATEDPERPHGQHGDEGQPDGEGRQPTLRGDLQRHVVQMRVDLLDAVGISILRVEALDHVGADAGERMILHHRDTGLHHGDPIPAARILEVEDREHASR